MTKRSVLEAAKALSIIVFVLAIAGLFVFGNYLMIEGHRPYHEQLSGGFTYPIPGKGGNVYVTLSDLTILVALVVTAAISATCANFISKSKN
jgi:hypothetical protein